VGGDDYRERGRLSANLQPWSGTLGSFRRKGGRKQRIPRNEKDKGGKGQKKEIRRLKRPEHRAAKTILGETRESVKRGEEDLGSPMKRPSADKRESGLRSAPS